MKCGLEQDWRKFAQNKSAWQGVVKMCADTINKEEEQKDDKQKRIQQSRLTAAMAGLICDHPNSNFTTPNQVGLMNHKFQKHASQTIRQCNHCRKSINNQGLPNHKCVCVKRH